MEANHLLAHANSAFSKIADVISNISNLKLR